MGHVYLLINICAIKHIMRKILLHQYLIVVVVLTMISVGVSAKGIAGHYSLEGFALSQNGDTLRNQQIFMHMNDHVDTIQTSAHGYYSAKVRWSSPCRSGTNALQRRRAAKKYNPKYIVFRYCEKRVKVRIHWKQCMRSAFDEPEGGKRQMNLVF